MQATSSAVEPLSMGCQQGPAALRWTLPVPFFMLEPAPQYLVEYDVSGCQFQASPLGNKPHAFAGSAPLAEFFFGTGSGNH